MSQNRWTLWCHFVTHLFDSYSSNMTHFFIKKTHQFWKYFINFSIFSGVAGKCNHETCTKAFVANRVASGPTREYCLKLSTHLNCLESMAKECKGDLHYHSDVKTVSKIIEKENCTAILTKEELQSGTFNEFDMIQEQNLTSTSSSQDVCDYSGDTTPSHCVLFGDPHLKTFSGEFMTCRIQKAWPLLSNPYLAVQVTNELVGPEHKATATTKVC